MFAGLTSLRYLNLSFCSGVTDAALEQLKGLPGLRQLYLRGYQRITDAGLLHLHGLADLRSLELTDCQGVTDAAVAALAARAAEVPHPSLKLPNLESGSCA